MPSFTLDTPHGLIAITDTALKDVPTPTLLLIHGNSSSSKIFRPFLTSPTLTSRYRIVTFDLPGHGSSSPAPHPDQSYTMPGYAALAAHILQHLNIERVVVFGWSLGGHIGIELVRLLQRPTQAHECTITLLGLMITGTPPALGAEQVARGFTMGGSANAGRGVLGLAGDREWSEETAVGFSKHSAAAGREECWEPWMVQDARGTDGRARVVMARAFTGEGNEGGKPVGVDQRAVVEEEDVLVAVVNGAEEQYVSLEYLEEIKWKNLWRGRCVRLEGLHHAPFWEDWDVFEKVLVEFLGDVERKTG